jgi:NAD(P)-dependent dehydrogenase (short-subunit alcohol dehydrogenase family)
MELSGKHVVVTGAASGIGEGLAVRFHAEGASVVAADRDGEGAARVAATLDG